MSNKDVAKAFRDGRPAKTRNMFSTGDAVYSYGWHYCIARRQADGTVLMACRPYSVSTAKHCLEVRRVLSDYISVWNPDWPAAMNLEKMEEREREIEAKVSRSRTCRDVWESLLNETRENMARYIEFSGCVVNNNLKRDFDY